MVGMSNLRKLTTLGSTPIWIDDAETINEDVWEVFEEPYYSWGPDGYGHPTKGFWRGKKGDQVNISTMIDSYLLNCIKFLRTKKNHFEPDVLNWPIYKELMNEAIKRGIDDRTDWDS
jgi:hypothetical protein